MPGAEVLVDDLVLRERTGLIKRPRGSRRILLGGVPMWQGLCGIREERVPGGWSGTVAPDQFLVRGQDVRLFFDGETLRYLPSDGRIAVSVSIE